MMALNTIFGNKEVEHTGCLEGLRDTDLRAVFSGMARGTGSTDFFPNVTPANLCNVLA